MKKKNETHTSKRDMQTRYLSQAIQLEESINPHIVRATMSMVSLALLVFIGWAGFTNINEVARASGEVVPQGYQQTVQHLEGGMVKEIFVHEGDVVEAGDVLIALDESALKDDLERARVRQLDLEMQEERLRAFIDGRTPDFKRFSATHKNIIADQNAFFDGMRNARQQERRVIRDQISEKRQAINALNGELKTSRTNANIAQNVYTKRQALNARGYASTLRLLDDERSLNNARGDTKRIESQIVTARSQIREYEARLSSLSASQRDQALEKLSLVSAELAQNIEIIEKMEERAGRLEIRAPARGLVKGLSVNTVGAVVQPAQTLMEIIPMDKALEIAVKISPQDIGHLKTDQPVQVKFSSFDFSRYGSVGGKLDHISATTFSGAQGERYYQGRVLLDQNYVGKDPNNAIMPGMTVMADVITGDKTILQYMLKPIHVSLKTAFTER